MNRVLRGLLSLGVALVLVASPMPVVSATASTTLLAEAVVLVNSASPTHADFAHYIQPYLDNFGVPYSVLDIATTDIGSELSQNALIVIGHRNLDPDGSALDTAEHDAIASAVEAGTGLVSFDGDLARADLSPRYEYVQRLFGFGYAGTGSATSLRANERTTSQVLAGTGPRLDCWEDSVQSPVLTTTSDAAMLSPTDDAWTEYLHPPRGYAGVFADTRETPGTMRFKAEAPNGSYYVVANLYRKADYRYQFGFQPENPRAFTFDVRHGTRGEFSEHVVAAVNVDDGTFELYTDGATLLSGTNDIYGWAWIRLVPRHPVLGDKTLREGIALSTGIELQRLTVPASGGVLIEGNGAPVVTASSPGQGRAIQWASYEWMKPSVRGPLAGMDDIVWRSMAWAARKPFAMQMTPPLLTMRVDDVEGGGTLYNPLLTYAEMSAAYGWRPYCGIFLDGIDTVEAASLKTLADVGAATVGVHARSDTVSFYYDKANRRDLPESQVKRNFEDAAAFFANHQIPRGKLVQPHYYELGTNTLPYLVASGTEFLATTIPVGKSYYDPSTTMLLGGPYRRYEAPAALNALQGLTYQDFIEVPENPTYSGVLFNSITELREQRYEWYPDTDVQATVQRGTLQVRRALQSGVPGTLFTHEKYLRTIPLGTLAQEFEFIRSNLRQYRPWYVDTDFAARFSRALVTSSIDSATQSSNGALSVRMMGRADMATSLRVFTDDGPHLSARWVDVPVFDGTLDHVVEPDSAQVPSVFEIAPALCGVSAPTTVIIRGAGFAGATSVRLSDSSNTQLSEVRVLAPDIIEARVPAGVEPGSYDVIVGTPAGTSVGGLMRLAVTSRPLAQSPQVLSVEPSSGAEEGGTPATISGTGFIGGARVLFGDVEAASVNVVDSRTITALSPPGVLGAAAVTVVNPDVFAGKSSLTGAFTYVSTVEPVVERVEPHGGVNTESTKVFIFGTDLSGTHRVQLDDPAQTLLTNVQVISDSEIRATVPAGVMTGSYNVSVTTGRGTNPTSQQRFQVFGVERINGWEDDHQDPVLATFTDASKLKTDRWNEFLWSNRGYPGIFGYTSNTTLPTMHFFGGVPNGTYEVVANLYGSTGRGYRYYYSFDGADPLARTIDVTGQSDFKEHSLGTIEVTDERFDLYFKRADLIAGSTHYYFGWSWVRLVPVGSAPVVASLSPDQAGEGEAVRVMVTGSGFTDAIAVRLDDGPGTLLTDVQVVDDTVLEGTVPSGLVPGSYNVRVTNRFGTNPTSTQRLNVLGTVVFDVCNDSNQDPVLVTFTDPKKLDPKRWNEFLWEQRGYPGVFGWTGKKDLPTFHAFAAVPNGTYDVYANLYGTTGRGYRYYFSFDAANPSSRTFDVTGQNDFKEHLIGQVDVTNGRFDLYFQKADRILGGTDYYFGWAGIRLVPAQ